MPYHIDEENSELAFEVYDGDKLIIRLKSGSGSGGCDIYIIKSGDNTEPTESNVFSAPWLARAWLGYFDETLYRCVQAAFEKP